MRVEDILTADKTAVWEYKSIVELELGGIEAQLEAHKGEEYNAKWHIKAMTALKHKKKEVNLCLNRLGVIKSQVKNELRKSHDINVRNSNAKANLQKILDRAIVDEVKYLVSPEEFQECIKRAQIKMKWEEAKAGIHDKNRNEKAGE